MATNRTIGEPADNDEAAVRRARKHAAVDAVLTAWERDPSSGLTREEVNAEIRAVRDATGS
ncbi:hypothetical protein [Amycolatopsis suaedae]|uniref:Uncharacterized protein n=1 Tax=Amycolatopsis suaedae TaxID=2510978 RepID=A0A4Q7J1S9_9PSEU|nr:hypothetical protein [Amycolatopsis suaedae]RZQ61370.1 hypothetical protein EWH70_23540 [Amycolatopsis suaedae]